MSKLETNTVDSISGTSTLTLGGSNASVVSAGTEVRSNKLSPASGTALQIGDSGDTITIPSGATIVNSGTQTGFGGNNQPYFQAALQTTAVTLSSGVNTKIPFNALTYNVGGGTWDSSNYRWTPGVAGKYFVTAQASISADSNNAKMSSTVILSQNGTIKHYIGGGNYRDEGQGRGHMDGNSAIMDLDDNDYIEALAQNTSESGANGRIDGETTQTFFSAFKLI